MTSAPSSSSGTGAGFGLEEIGIPGRDFLREALTSCTDPLKAIEDFQIENGILLPSLRPMLPLLDLHGIKRLDFHNSVLEDLRERLIAQVATVGANPAGNPKERERKLKELLVKSFPVIKIKQLRPVVMAILKHMSFIEDRFLRVLVRDKELYADCDIAIKRHLWRDNQSLFGDEVSPFLSQYIKEKEEILYSGGDGAQREASLGGPSSALAAATAAASSVSAGFFGVSPKGRRQAEVVRRLAEMIGSNVKLYDMTLQFLRTLFLRTRNVHYCTLRAELLMALHDLEVQDIISVDPCHKFTWCLDACIREKNVDVKRSRELQGFLDAIRRGQEQVSNSVGRHEGMISFARISAGSWRPLHDSLRPVRHQLPRHLGAQDHEPPGGPRWYAQGERGSPPTPSDAHSRSVGVGDDRDPRVRRGWTTGLSRFCTHLNKSLCFVKLPAETGAKSYYEVHPCSHVPHCRRLRACSEQQVTA